MWSPRRGHCASTSGRLGAQLFPPETCRSAGHTGRGQIQLGPDLASALCRCPRAPATPGAGVCEGRGYPIRCWPQLCGHPPPGPQSCPSRPPPPPHCAPAFTRPVTSDLSSSRRTPAAGCSGWWPGACRVFSAVGVGCRGGRNPFLTSPGPEQTSGGPAAPQTGPVGSCPSSQLGPTPGTCQVASDLGEEVTVTHLPPSAPG